MIFFVIKTFYIFAKDSFVLSSSDKKYEYKNKQSSHHNEPLENEQIINGNVELDLALPHLQNSMLVTK